METLNTKISNATKWSTLAEVSAKLILPIVNMILARLLTPESFGIVTTISIIITFAEIFQDAGFQKFIIQHDFKDENDFNESANVAFWTNLILSLVIISVFFIFKDALAGLVGKKELGLEIVVASLSIPIFSLCSIQVANYKRNFDFKRLFWVRMITSFIPLISTVPLAFILRNHWALLIGTVIRNFVQALILCISSKWRPCLKFNFSKLKSMIPFCLWTLFESITIWLSGNISIFIVTRILGFETVGYYKTAISTVTSILGIFSAATTAVLFSSLSRVQNNNDEFNRVFYNYQKLTSVLIIPTGVGIFLYRNLVTLILLGKKWMICADFIGIYSLALSFTTITSYFFSELYRAKGKPKISMVAQILYMIVLAPVIYFSSERGFDVLCVATSSLLIIFSLIHFILIKILFKDISVLKILTNISQVLIPTLLMTGMSYLLQAFSTNMYWQVISIVICIFTYFTSVILFRPLRNMIKTNPLSSALYNKITKLFKLKKL